MLRARTRVLNRQRKLLNEPAGTTGCAPESKPLPLAAGVEYAVRISGCGPRCGSALAVCPEAVDAGARAVSTGAFGATSRVFGADTAAAGAGALGGGAVCTGAEGTADAVRTGATCLGFAARSVLTPR